MITSSSKTGKTYTFLQICFKKLNKKNSQTNGNVAFFQRKSPTWQTETATRATNYILSRDIGETVMTDDVIDVRPKSNIKFATFYQIVKKNR